ncbi:MAG: sulfotransferase [Pirellulales bacterium]|nr:sulfotransferase [Pirellulales bacterium]
MDNATDETPGEKIAAYKDRFWDARFLDGMSFSGWFRLLVRNRFAVGPRRVCMALIVTTLAVMNSTLWAVQQLLYGRKLARTKIEHAPIFIIGHWRSGTTLLHELLVLDPRHTYPNSYQCFAPNHFLVSSWLFKRCFWFLMPARRPMDNMPLGFDRPQEDEFALCNLGVPSPYLTIAFPNRPPQDQPYLTLRGLSAEALDRWKEAFLWFLKCLTLRDARRIVLKSPPHTARIKTLLELFPEARFVHIVRDPHVLFPSTLNLWKRLYRRDGLQKPHYQGLEQHVFETFNRMYEAFEEDRGLLEPRRCCEVRYEDLVADPIGEMRRVYNCLELGQFDQALPGLQEYLASQKDYKTNCYQISTETKAEIARHWGPFIQRYGYGDNR